MTEIKTTITGWKAVVIAVALLALVGYRIATIGKPSTDEHLLRAVKNQLIMEQYPRIADQVKNLYESGETEGISELAQSFGEEGIRIHSVTISSPLFSFSTKKKVIAKVSYTLTDTTDARTARVRYISFDHYPLSQTYRYRYDSSALSYFLNFM